MMKKLGIAALVMGMMNAAYAVNPGFYLGAMLGQTNLGVKKQSTEIPTDPPTILTANPQNTGLGFRFFLGGNFNQYAGMEGGLTYYSSASYSTPGFTNNIRTRAESFDIEGKGMLPLMTSGFTLFGKLGLAYLNTKTSGSIDGESISKTTSSSVRPVIGVGVSYDMTQHWVADLSYMRIQYKSSAVNNPSLIALGISYHFVDEYCGQFLC